MTVTTRDATIAADRVQSIWALLDGLSGQEVADVLILALVEHIELAAPEHRQTLARGACEAILANFETEQ